MANIKISNLEKINIDNPDDSYIMVVAPNTDGAYKNYRITLSELIDIIGNIEYTGGLTENEVNILISQAIENDNLLELTEDQVQKMIDNSIATDNLKDIVTEVIPEATIAVDESTEVTVTEVATKVLTQETTVSEVQNTVQEITKEITEECVCEEHADECFCNIFV